MKQNSLLDKIRRVLSILLNLAVVRMEPIAIRMSWEAVGEQTLTFYTENSNLFSAAVCLLVAAATAISGIKYLWDNRSFINTAK